MGAREQRRRQRQQQRQQQWQQQRQQQQRQQQQQQQQQRSPHSVAEKGITPVLGGRIHVYAANLMQRSYNTRAGSAAAAE